MGKKTPKKKGGGGGPEGWMRDETDDANAEADARFAKMDKDYIGFKGVTAGDSSGDDEDDDGFPDEEDEEGLMNVEDSSSSDDDDDDEDDDDEDEELDDDDELDEYSDSEEAALAKAMKAQKKRLDGKVRRDRVMSEDEDGDDDDEDDEEDGFGIKGKKKMDFYGDDDIDHEGLSDEEDRLEEEKEARRMRRLMAEEMKAEDFGVDSEDEEEAEATLGAKAASLRRGDGKASKATRSVEVETLTAEERATAEDDAAAANDAPELMALTKELTSTLSAIEATVEPLVKAAKDGSFATADGISYLDTKYLLMLSYCSSIVFYLLLKAEGKSVKDHPVIERLVEIRLYLEKLRPIDKKLQYQVRDLPRGFRFCFVFFCFKRTDGESLARRCVAVMKTLTAFGLTTH